MLKSNNRNMAHVSMIAYLGDSDADHKLSRSNFSTNLI
jgi:hypothetical protein